MANSVNKEIGGVLFSIYCQDAVILPEPDPAYQLFLKKTDKTRSDICIDVELHLGGVPATRGMSKIFETSQAWSMFVRGSQYFLEFKPAGFKEPLWLTRYDLDFAEIQVYCGKKLIRDERGKTFVSNPVRYPLDQVLLMYVLSFAEGVLLHAAGVNIGGRGMIFPGKSGAGKSTLSKQFITRDSSEVLNDDRMVVRKIDGAFKAFGTPWPGEAGITLNKSMPLSGVFFIHHSSDNVIKEISPQEALERFLPVTSIPWYDQEIMSKILTFCEGLVTSVPAYDLYFKPGPEVAELLEEFKLA